MNNMFKQHLLVSREVIWQSKNVEIVRNRPCFDFLYFRHSSPIKVLDNIFLFSYPEQ